MDDISLCLTNTSSGVIFFFFSPSREWLFLPLLLLYICLSSVSMAVINIMTKKKGILSLTVSPS